MSAEELDQRIRDAVQLVESMDERTRALASEAGLLDSTRGASSAPSHEGVPLKR